MPKRYDAYFIAVIILLGVIAVCEIVSTYIGIEFALAVRELGNQLQEWANNLGG